MSTKPGEFHLENHVSTHVTQADFQRAADGLKVGRPWQTKDLAKVVHALILDRLQNVEKYNPDAVRRDREMARFSTDDDDSYFNITWYREDIERLLEDFEQSMQELRVSLS